MIFRFTLTDEGNNSKVISEPSGWEDAQLGFERSDWFSLVEVFESTFLTYGANSNIDGGRDWIKNVETTYGIDSNLAVLVEGDYYENGNWETVYKGILPIQMFVESLDISGNLLQIVFSGPDFWSYWKARYGTQVDVRGTQTVSEQAQLLTGTVIPTPYINLPLPSQKIIKQYQGIQKYNQLINLRDPLYPSGISQLTFQFTGVDLDTDIINEIDTKFEYGVNGFDTIPFALFIVKDSGEMEVDFSFSVSMADNTADGADGQLAGNQNRNVRPDGSLNGWIQVNGETPIQCGIVHRTYPPFLRNDGQKTYYVGSNGELIDFVFKTTGYGGTNQPLSLRKNDSVRFYLELTGTNQIPTPLIGGNIIAPIVVYGSQGWQNENFPFLLSGWEDAGYSRYSGLVSSALDASLPHSANPQVDSTTGYPLYTIDGVNPPVAGDSYIVGVAGNINGIAVDIGWIVQALVSNPGTSITKLLTGTVSCSPSSAVLTGVGTHFTSLITSPALHDSTGRFIGNIASITDDTHLTLLANPSITLSGATFGVLAWWVSQISIMSGLEAYGRSHLNVIFNTTSDDAATGLFQAAGINAYTLTDPNITGPLEVGDSLYVQFANNNTGASTLNIDGGGAVPIINPDGSALIANDIISTLIAAGTNTYTLAAYAGLTQLIEGLILVVKFTNANTGASTLNVNSFGAISIYTKIGAAGAGEIPAGSVLALVYDGTNFVITDTDQTVSGQIYVLNYDGGSFVLTPISNTEGITPTATKTAQAFLAHDVAAGICDRITEVSGLFYSDYFGNPWTSIPHASIGCGSNTALLKGLHVRGYTLPQKSYFSSMQDWYEGAHPIHCIGIGYETINGQDAIVCEPMDHFFDASSMSILLSNVQNIKRYADNDNIFNQIQIGFSKWESQADTGTGSPSGLDDPQSQRNLLTRFKFVGQLITILSGWVGASLTLETTRRKGNLLSANYTYDNDTFVVATKSNGDGTFTPELNENFSSITNLNNKETRYNNRITPMRNFLRWIDYLSGCLQDYRSSSRFSFTSGTGNYNMASTMSSNCPGDDTGVNVAENGNFPISMTPLFIPKLFEIEHELDWQDYKTLRANKNKAIGISQTNTGHVPFFIKSCRYQIAKGTFKITAWCKQPFNIQIIESTLSHRRHGDEYAPNYD